MQFPSNSQCMPDVSNVYVNGLKANPEARSVVSALWDRIVDWFCQTHRAEAKELLREYVHADSDQKKAQIFCELKALAGVGYQSNFVERVDTQGVLELVIMAGEDTLCSDKISLKIEKKGQVSDAFIKNFQDDVSAEKARPFDDCKAQSNKDWTRGNLKIGAEELRWSEGGASSGDFRQQVDIKLKNLIGDGELYQAVVRLFNQSSFASHMCTLSTLEGLFELAPGDKMCFAALSEVHYEIQKTASGAMLIFSGKAVGVEKLVLVGKDDNVFLDLTPGLSSYQTSNCVELSEAGEIIKYSPFEYKVDFALASIGNAEKLL